MKESNNVNGPLNLLDNIGTRLSDFEEINEKNKNYSLLAKGFFGYNEKMKSKKDNKIYAIKKIVKNSPAFTYKNFFRETEIMKLLNHENIVKYYGYFEDKEKIEKYKNIFQSKPGIENENEDKEILCLVFEYVPNDTLENYYKNNKSLDQQFLIKIFKQLLNALAYLKEKNVLHRDFKFDKFLLDENYNIKVSDFELAALLDDKNQQEEENKNIDLYTNYERVGRIDFIAPEIERNEENVYKIDIFSLGLTMLILMSSKYPIKLERNKDTHDIRRRIINKNLDDMDAKYNIYLRKLVLRLIEKDASKRPNPEKALEQLNTIESYINNPNNLEIKNALDQMNNP